MVKLAFSLFKLIFACGSLRVTNFNVPFLEHNDRILLKVWHIDSGALFEDIFVLSQHQPADVWEEKPSLRVMGVRVRLRELVVNPEIKKLIS